MNTFLEAAELVLRENNNQPLHYTDITRLALAKGYLQTDSADPAHSMHSAIWNDSKAVASRLIQIGSRTGIYRLRLANEVIQPITPNPAPTESSQSPTPNLSVIDTIVLVLQDNNNQPLRTQDIANQVIAKGCLSPNPDRPDKHVQNAIWQDVNSATPRLIKVEKGIYRLRLPNDSTPTHQQSPQPTNNPGRGSRRKNEPTEEEIQAVENKLKAYRQRYLRAEYAEADESSTRIMVNYFLTSVLDYQEIEEIKTEYRIRGEYADYVIQLDRENKFIVEVKAIKENLKLQHLRQSLNYAANDGIDWIVLFNGRYIELYRVIFSKPIREKKLFSYDLQDLSQIKQAANDIIYLNKKSVSKGRLEHYWARRDALAVENIAQFLYAPEVINHLKKFLKREAGIACEAQEIEEALRGALQAPIDIDFKMKE